MPRAQLRAFRDWFMLQIPIRLGVLEQVVRSTAGFEQWTPDFSEASLRTLGQWFIGQVEKRDVTPEEKAAALSSPGNERLQIVPTYQLTNKSYSLAIDVAMYWGETLRRSLENVTWQQYIGGKTMSDYGHVILQAPGTASCDPLHLAIIQVHKVFSGTRTDLGRLDTLFLFWRKVLSTPLEKRKRS